MRRARPPAAAALVSALTAALAAGCHSDYTEEKLRKDRLQDEDCTIGATLYQERLKAPLHAGIVVTGTDRPQPTLSEEAQAMQLLSFNSECRTLVGRARRALVRCWTDATDAASTRACNSRF